MKPTLTMATFLAAAVLTTGVALADDVDANTSNSKSYVKDSAITTKVKSKLAAQHVTSLGRIHVDTDADGVVYLSGSAKTQADADQAVSIARDTDGVRGVKSNIKVTPAT